MKRLIPPLTFALGLLLGYAVSIYTVNFTVVLSQAQVDIANWKWNQVDPTHTQFATVQLFGAGFVNNDIENMRLERWADRKLSFGTSGGYFCVNTWPGLSQGTKDGICTARGEATGCNVCEANGN